MSRSVASWFRNALCPRLVMGCLAVAIFLVGLCAGQEDMQLSEVGEGCLLYKSPVAGRYELVPLVHTDVAIDVRGLVASATVTQQYSNSSSEPIEAIYVFPLPQDGAVYDMEIRIGNRVIREREEAKRVYEAANSEGKHAALVEQERPNIFTTSGANLLPGDEIG